MACCVRYEEAEAQFNRKIAERDLQRYRKKGADPTTRMLLEEIRRWPLQGKHLLDVGGGIGILGAELGREGLAGVTMVEASSAYLEVARGELAARNGALNLEFLHGDFAAMGGTVADADVVTLDRVVCCYPDANELLRAAAARARELFCFTYPRDRWYVRMMMALENLVRRVMGNKFRTFVHPAEQMAEVLREAGLKRAEHRRTLVWAIELYRRG